MKRYKIKTFNNKKPNFNIFYTYRGFMYGLKIDLFSNFKSLDKLYNDLKKNINNPPLTTKKLLDKKIKSFINDFYIDFNDNKNKLLKYNKKIVKLYRLFFKGYGSYKREYIAGWKLKNGMKIVWINKQYTYKKNK